MQTGRFAGSLLIRFSHAVKCSKRKLSEVLAHEIARWFLSKANRFSKR